MRNTLRESINRLDMEILKRESVLVHDGMEIHFPQFDKREHLHIKHNLKPLTYAYNNSVIAFVDEHSTFYVIPAFQGISQFLEDNGYRKSSFYVPFSNWDYPIAQKEKWEKLLEKKHAKI